MFVKCRITNADFHLLLLDHDYVFFTDQGGDKVVEVIKNGE